LRKLAIHIDGEGVDRVEVFRMNLLVEHDDAESLFEKLDELDDFRVVEDGPGIAQGSVFRFRPLQRTVTPRRRQSFAAAEQ
jgi:hypothetical protein